MRCSRITGQRPGARALAAARPGDTASYLDVYAGLGMAAIYAVQREIIRDFDSRIDLTGIPMPASFKKLFQDWADRKVSFVELAEISG